MAVGAMGYSVEVIGYPVPAATAAAWEALAAQPLEANPFLCPAYLEPLARHYARDAEWRLALVWQDKARSRLVGLAPVTLGHVGRSMARRVVPHLHRLLPLGHPLLSADPHEALQALEALVAHLGDGLAVDLANIPRDGPTDTLLRAVCEAKGWVHDTAKNTPLTHGLHLPSVPALPGGCTVRVMTAPGDVRAGLEEMLGMTSGKTADHAASFTFLRAMSRSMAQQGQLVLALIETPSGETPSGMACALALTHGTQAWVWRMEGVQARDPVVQAVLCKAIGDITGAPPHALVKPRLTGLGCAPLATQNWSIIKALHRPAGRSMLLTARRMAASIF
jgi:hypothetical protein